MKFKPSLVGGHCIGIDPYYMIHKAESLGYFPAVIGAGRRVNDNMGIYVANKVFKLMVQKGIAIKGSSALLLSITFKENCTDIRYTRVIDIFDKLRQFGLNVDIYDPWADSKEVKHEYGIDLISKIETEYNALVLAVSYDEFPSVIINLIDKNKSIFFDIKSVIDLEIIDGRL
jgi:UDP-N-acetyl-D-galactosamine dehydrogenase